ncbi:MAG: DNA polymerase I [Candidatus Nanopelagicaceae bacterium]
MNPRILLIDGHSLAYRAFYALPVENFSTSSGQPTNAIYGFAAMLINLIRDEKPTHVIIAFDVSRKTFRTEAFPEYKANRAATPDEFRSQLSYINELIEAFQIPSFEAPGFEADDVIASIIQNSPKSAEILICTGDRDAFQLITKNVTVLYPKKGVTDLSRITPEVLMERYGLTPQQYPDYAALRGDPSDNLPSIPGVGEKTAAKWITEYGNLSNLINHISEVSGKVGDSLRENVKIIQRNRELTELRKDVPIHLKFDELSWRGVNLEKTMALFENLEIKALRERVQVLANSESQASLAKDEKKAREDKTKKVDWRNISAKDFVEALGQDRKVAALTVGEVLYAVTDNGTAISTPVKSGLLDGKEVITHGGKDLVKAELGCKITFDSEIAAYLINPGTRDLDLPAIVKKYLGWESQPSNLDLFAGPIEPNLIHSLYTLEESLVNEMKSRELYSLFEKLEMPTMELIAQMEKVGIGVDQKYLNVLRTEFLEIESDAIKSAHREAGEEFNLSSPKQLQVILFEKLKLPKTKRIKTGFSTDAESLEWLFHTTKHKVLANILKTREFTKLRTTVEGLIECVGSDSRIHTSFQQTVTATGRLSSINPNLQNIPIRSEEGRRIREAFVAISPFNQLMTADYSQIEMRIMAHLSEDEGLLKAFAEGEDLHRTVAAQVFGVAETKVDEDMRRQIKAMSYGLAYGLSSFGLAQQLDITPNEASALMDRYFLRFGGIQSYLKDVVRIAREKGFTETIMGRRRYLPDLSHENRQRREVAERMALNAPIQGSAADIIKEAMIRVSDVIKEKKMKSRLLLQVHDELIFEVAVNEESTLEELVRIEMGSAYPLKAPLDVNVGFGRNWHEAAH